MNLKLLLSVFLLLFSTIDPLVTHNPVYDSEFLVPSKTRISNEIADFEYLEIIERSFTSFMNRWNIRGASVAVSNGGRLVFAHGYGYADTVTKQEVQPYHRFRIASVSKLITAVAIMRLCEEGRISMHDRVFGVDGILNDSLFAAPRDKRVYSITVAHLLGHRGGWSVRYGDHMFITPTVARLGGYEMPLSTEDYVRFALDRRLHFTPGTGSSYSNLGYAILGLVIEKVSGMDYEEYCRREILEPVGIYDFALAKNLESDRLPNEVKYYEHEDALPKLSVYGTGEMVSAAYGGNDIESLMGAGAWVATAPDLMRLLLAVDGFDYNPDIISSESVETMTDIRNGYAPLGWKSTYENGVWWRTGFFPGTTAMMKRMPGGISWVVILNSSAWNGPELTNDINTLMNRVIARVGEWPQYDLFRYSLPVPIKEYIQE